MGNDTIMKYAKINADYVTFASGEERKWENTNELINPEILVRVSEMKDIDDAMVVINDIIQANRGRKINITIE